MSRLVITTCAFGLLATGPSPHARALPKGQVSTAAARCKGSSDPTLLNYNRRLTRTARGRLLALYDTHGSGQQLVWKDRGRRWRTKTRGDVTDGFFPQVGGGDRPATIALARAPTGRQQAWAVYGDRNFEHDLSVYGRRISDLNDPNGPRVGPQFTIDAGGILGTARPDLAFERTRGGKWRGVVSWLRLDSGGYYEMTVRWFTNLSKATPRVHHRTTLFRSSGPTPTGTFVRTRSGVKLVTVTGRGRFRIFIHDAKDPLGRWKSGRDRNSTARASRPSAVVLRTGTLLVAVESDLGSNIVKVLRWPKGHKPRAALRLKGHKQPSLTRVGRRLAFLVMVRTRDGKIVSRRFRPGHGWTRRDRVEVGRRGERAWPNTIATSKRTLRFVVQGLRCPYNVPHQNGVLAYSRRV